MAPTSDPAFLVLHALRVLGTVGAGVIAARTGLGPDDVAARLAHAEAAGLARRRVGRLAGWSLTSGGRVHHRALAEADVTGAARPAAEAAYRRFRGLNPTLLQVCTDWQLRAVDGERRVNDHADPRHDAAVLTRLGAVHERARPVCDDLAAVRRRFAGYGPDLDAALARVRAGDGAWLTSPTVRSYHEVWFELHEDLLASLGIERSDEKAIA